MELVPCEQNGSSASTSSANCNAWNSSSSNGALGGPTESSAQRKRTVDASRDGITMGCQRLRLRSWRRAWPERAALAYDLVLGRRSLLRDNHRANGDQPLVLEYG